jgi:RNA polymerase sigma factor (sigma-70 family)
VIDTSALDKLLNKCLTEGTAQAWEEFVRPTRRAVALQIVRTLRQWIRPTADQVEDLTQEAFLKICDKNFAVLRRLASEPESGILAYLRTVAASTAVDYVRARAAQRRGGAVHHESLDAAQSAIAGAVTEQDKVDHDIFLQQVDRCLESNPELKARDRGIFWLHFKQGFTSRSISELKHLELTQKGVESLLFRLIRAVRDCLKRRGIEVSGSPIPEGKIFY